MQRLALLVAFFTASAIVSMSQTQVRLNFVGTRATGVFNQGAAEIVAHDSVTQRLFVVNGANSSIDVLSLSGQGVPSYLFSINIDPFGAQANSVDVCNGLVAAAVQADVKVNKGTVEFFDAFGNHLKSMPAGSLPDMVTFTPGCGKVLVANEGEPNSYGQPDSADPEGSVTVVDLHQGLAKATSVTIRFNEFNGTTLDPTIRVFGPGATIAQDLEPEYIAVAPDLKTARVTLQENNAIAILDLEKLKFTELIGLGFKDHNLPRNKFDASDRDVPGSSNNGIINIRNWPVFGMFLPDAIASYTVGGETYYVTANEGDARDWPGFDEEVRVGSVTLDAAAFAARGYMDVSTGAAGLRNNDNLGRLNITSTLGNTDADSDFESLYSFGTRSFSIWNQDGKIVYDSGDDFEQITAQIFPSFFNASNDDNALDSRSDNKGPEPEAVEIAEAYGRTYAFIGLERIGGVMVYDITDPFNVDFVQYVNNRNFTAPVNSAAALDLGPEGLHFIPANESPTGVPLLAVANEVSGTTTIYEFRQSTVEPIPAGKG
jgi:hypothetical protein